MDLSAKVPVENASTLIIIVYGSISVKNNLKKFLHYSFISVIIPFAVTLIAWKRRLLRASGTNPSRRLRRLFRGAKVKFRETGDKSLYPKPSGEIRK